MCGICGFINFKEDGLIERMSQTLLHRGPDEAGFYKDDTIALGHRRLSIIDLTSGKQPIHNEDSSVWVILNGQIYNYIELRQELSGKGHRFYTFSDTEVIVHAYEEYGLDCVKYFNGEFAIALWDKKKKRLALIRDRLGIRPVYYSYINGGLIFASELKSVLCYGKIGREINEEALDQYLTLRYVLADESVIKGVYRLPEASILTFSNEGESCIRRYWEISFEEKKAKKEAEYIEEFTSLLTDSVSLRLRSDVPVGAFLSGGLDSSVIVSMMKTAGCANIKTFCIGFGTDIDETRNALEMADFLGTEHTTLSLDKQSYQFLFKIIKQLDEPIGDSIIIPTYILSSEAAKSVKVVLTGEGADEILAGYIHHSVFQYGSLYKKYTPDLIQRIFSAVINKVPLGYLNRAFSYPASLGHRGKDRLMRYLSCKDKGLESFFVLTSIFGEEEKLGLYSNDFYQGAIRKKHWQNELCRIYNPLYNGLNQIINFDMHNWLVNYTLFKQDRLSMANSVEARVPYLDHRLVEFCARLPLSLKLNGFSTKHILRKSAAKFIPKETVKAKKKAFYLPTEKCFGQDFNQFVKEILSESVLCKRGIFQKVFIERLFNQGQTSEILSNKQIMSLLILELWYREYIDKSGV